MNGRKIARYLAGFLFALCAVLFVNTISYAQLAGQIVGGCPERAMLTERQIAVASAFSLLDPNLNTVAFWPRGSVEEIQIRSCGKDIRRAYCTDKILNAMVLGGALDPSGAMIGAGVGAFLAGKGSRLQGGLFGGVVGGLLGKSASIRREAVCRSKSLWQLAS